MSENLVVVAYRCAANPSRGCHNSGFAAIGKQVVLLMKVEI